jgi:hypothetical protein
MVENGAGERLSTQSLQVTPETRISKPTVDGAW